MEFVPETNKQTGARTCNNKVRKHGKQKGSFTDQIQRDVALVTEAGSRRAAAQPSEGKRAAGPQRLLDNINDIEFVTYSLMSNSVQISPLAKGTNQDLDLSVVSLRAKCSDKLSSFRLF